MAKADDIVTAADAQLANLESINDDLNAKVATIKNTGGKPLTAQQKQDIGSLRDQQATIATAIAQLSGITLAALDKSDDIEEITAGLADVVADLKAKATQIATISTNAQNISKISKAISGLIPQIKSLGS